MECRYYWPVPTGKLVVRHPRESDAGEIVDIYNHAVQHTTATFDLDLDTVGQRTEWIRHHTGMSPAIVAEIDDSIVGWASLSPWAKKKAYEKSAEASLYIHPQWSGHGIGTELTREILRLGKTAGLHTVLTRIADGNDVSRKLCEKFGFRYMGVMKEAGWKFDSWIDVHFYQLVFDEEE